MRYLTSFLCLVLLSIPVRAEDKPAKGKIVALDLFKNGLVVVRVEVTLDGPGVYVLDRVPEAVHGTYWIQSEAEIESQVQTREVDVPAHQVAGGNLQVELAGKNVTIHLRGGHIPPVRGIVVDRAPPRADDAASDDDLAAAHTRAYGTPAPASRYLILRTPTGQAYLDSAEIAFVESEGTQGKLKQKKPVLLLSAKGTGKSATVSISYLARGISWAPSYRVDISDAKMLVLEQNAVVRNELVGVRDCNVALISGYPSIQFAHVTSPMSPRTTWEAFFQQLNQRAPAFADGLSNSVMQQSIAYNRSGVSPTNLGAIPVGEGVDLHYQSIGKRTLGKSESLALTVARGSTGYERIVEWLVPDTRDEYGNHANPNRGQEEESSPDAPWDALRFKNPLAFPMTTGPAMVVANGRFNGQRTSYWVNAGEETTLRVTKALSVRTRCVEHEEQHDGNETRQVVYIGGQRYRRSQVQGDIAVSNHRKEGIKLVMRRRFSGDLLAADGSPKTQLREEGVWSVNKRQELLWTLMLKPGEETKLTYRYAVLVRF